MPCEAYILKESSFERRKIYTKDDLDLGSTLDVPPYVLIIHTPDADGYETVYSIPLTHEQEKFEIHDVWIDIEST